MITSVFMPSCLSAKQRSHKLNFSLFPSFTITSWNKMKYLPTVLVWLIMGTIATAFRLHSLTRAYRMVLEASGNFATHYQELTVPTGRGISLIDVTKDVSEILKSTGISEGIVTVLSKHSTVSVTINEMEPRLVDDTRQFLLKLAPPHYPYLHNDLDQRVGPPDWPGGDKAWREFRAKEPVNAHSHLIAFVMGTSESIPVHKGEMKIGKYQNIIVVDADGTDGTKKRTIAIQIMGTK